MKLHTTVRVSILTKSTRVGTRVRARATGIPGCITIPWDHYQTETENMQTVANLYAARHHLGKVVGIMRQYGKWAYIYEVST